MLGINDLVIDAYATIGEDVILCDVKPGYKYVDQKRTDEIECYRYTCVLPQKGYEKIKIKIDSKNAPSIGNDDCPCNVTFTDLRIKLYFDGTKHQFTSSATGIKKL